VIWPGLGESVAAELLEGNALVVAGVLRVVLILRDDLVEDLAQLFLVVGVAEDVKARRPPSPRSRAHR
jgi:hypothetical protein